MKYLENFIISNSDLLFFICIIELIIIVALIVYIYQMRKINNVNNDDINNNDIIKWKNECNKLNRKVSELEKNLKTVLTTGVTVQRVDSSVHDNKNEKHDADTNRSAQSYNGWSDYIKEQNAKRGDQFKDNENETNDASDNTEEKRCHVEETINDDGTTRTDVIFVNREYKYLEAANAGQFRKLLPSDEKSFFRTWVENGVRKFEFHGNVDKALANINAIFDDVCEIEGKQNGATRIDNVDPGILTSQLKVDTPAKIKLS